MEGHADPSLYFCPMNHMPSLLNDAVEAFASLPGIGRKTALRLALHLLRKDELQVKQLADALSNFRTGIRQCSRCHNLSDQDLCRVCSDSNRNQRTICLVESVRDILAIEETRQYNGLYHVLGGIINPLEGIGPDQLNLHSLRDRVAEGQADELILAISPTIEGDTTIYYISRMLRDLPVRMTTIARGVSFGGELEYADEITLGRSILSRVPYATNDLS
jgi:recombination protein RecR